MSGDEKDPSTVTDIQTVWRNFLGEQYQGIYDLLKDKVKVLPSDLIEDEEEWNPIFNELKLDGQNRLIVKKLLRAQKANTQVPGFQGGPGSSAATSHDLPGGQGSGAAAPLFEWAGTPELVSFESVKAATATTIKTVLYQSKLEVQQAAYGPLLKRPFPPATYSESDRPGWSPFFLAPDEIIDYQVYKEFRTLVSAKYDNATQKVPIYVPLQISGGGKTKLCITLAMERGAVIIRLNRFTNASSEVPFAPVVNRAYDIMCQTSDPKTQLEFFQGTQKMADLWVLSYFHFLEDFSAWYMSQGFPENRLAEFFFRAVENGCFQCITKYLADVTYLANLEHKNAYNGYREQRLKYAAQHAPFIVYDDIVGMEDVMVGYFPHLPDPDHEIVQHQLYEIKTRRPAGDYHRTTNVMYALCSFADLVRPMHIKTILTGTKYSVIRALVFGNTTSSGPSRGRAEYSLFPSPPDVTWPLGFKAATLQGFLHRFVSAPETSFKLRDKLADVEYLAASFFDTFLSVLERKMFEGKPKNQDDLLAVLFAALDGVKPLIQERAESNVQRFLTARDPDAEKKRENMMQLYYAIVMHNGEIGFLKSDPHDAVAHNIAWIKSPNHGEYTSQVIAEPAVELAISSAFNLQCPPDESPVFQVLSKTIAPIADKGRFAEEVTAHVFQRYSKSLLDFITDTTQDPKKASRPSQGISSNSVVGNHKFHITRCGTHKEFCHRSQLYGMTHNAPGFALFPGTSAKVDIKTELIEIDFDGDAKLPCYSQVKNYAERISLSLFEDECLPALDPECFFIKKHKLRTAWLEWWNAHQHYFDSYVRIVVSYSGFTEEVYEAVANYNAKGGVRQPILLVQVPKLLLGNLAYNAVIAKKQDIPRLKQTKILKEQNFSILPLTESRFEVLRGLANASIDEVKRSKTTEDKKRKNTIAYYFPPCKKAS